MCDGEIQKAGWHLILWHAFLRIFTPNLPTDCYFLMKQTKKMIDNRKTPLSVLPILLLLWALGGFPSLLMGQKTSPSFDFPEGKEGIAQMIEFTRDASRRQLRDLAYYLKPTPEEYPLAFKEPFIKNLRKYHKRLWKNVDVIIKPYTKAQTEALIWAASPSELEAYSTDDAQHFPGGYREIAQYMNEEVVFYRFRFVAPGRRIGSGYDAFVYLKGKWWFFPRPWMANL